MSKIKRKLKAKIRNSKSSKKKFLDDWNAIVSNNTNSLEDYGKEQSAYAVFRANIKNSSNNCESEMQLHEVKEKGQDEHLSLNEVSEAVSASEQNSREDIAHRKKSDVRRLRIKKAKRSLHNIQESRGNAKQKKKEHYSVAKTNVAKSNREIRSQTKNIQMENKSIEGTKGAVGRNMNENVSQENDSLVNVKQDYIDHSASTMKRKRKKQKRAEKDISFKQCRVRNSDDYNVFDEIIVVDDKISEMPNDEVGSRINLTTGKLSEELDFPFCIKNKQESDNKQENDKQGSLSEREVSIDSNATLKREKSNKNEQKIHEFLVLSTDLKPFECHSIQSSVDFSAMPFSKLQDSVENGKEAFAWIIAPYDIEIFFRNVFERKVYVTNRKEPNYYGDLFSSAMFVEILQKNFVEYGTNINVALYNGDERKTLNGTGRVYPEQIKIHLKEGRSIQLINPQTFCDNVWYLCDTLQEFFGSFVGANTYLTPAGSAGFAPHWDDIDAFLMQIEGRKNWKVYAPQNECDELPRESSKNFSNDDMKNAKLIFEGWLEQGDLLYIPRGFIHQGYTGAETHSLHLTVSFCRNTAFIDLLEKLLPVTLSSLANNLRGLRQSLPVQYLDMEGVLRKNYKLSDQFALRFTDFLDSHLQNLRAFSSQFYAAGLDMMACDFMKNALPPMLTQEEKRLSVLGDSNFNIFGTLKKFKKTTEIRLLRRHTQRLFFETEDECFIAHRIENSRVSEGRPEVLFNLDKKFIDGFIFLSNFYPSWCKVSDLRCSPEETNVELAELLYSNGILLARF